MKKNFIKFDIKNYRLLLKIILGIFIFFHLIFGTSSFNKTKNNMSKGNKLKSYSDTEINNSVAIEYFGTDRIKSILIALNEHNILISQVGDKRETRIVNQLKNIGVKKIDYLFCTRQQNNLSELENIVSNFEVGKLYFPIDMSDYVNNKSTIIQNVPGELISYVNETFRDNYELENIYLNILGNKKDSYAVNIVYGKNSLVFGFDTDDKISNNILKKDNNIVFLQEYNSKINDKMFVNKLNNINANMVVVPIDNNYEIDKNILNYLSEKNISIYKSRLSDIIILLDSEKIIDIQGASN